MKTKAQNESYEQLFREFAARQLDKKYSPRKVTRGAACQEYVRFEADLEKDPLPREGSRVLVWRGAGGITRLAAFKVLPTGKDTLSVRPETGNQVALAQATLLRKDIAECTHTLPVALCIEPREACSTIALQEVQPWVDAYTAAALINRNSIITVNALTQTLAIPASSRMVFEGYIHKSESAASESDAFTIHLSCITGQM